MAISSCYFEDEILVINAGTVQPLGRGLGAPSLQSVVLVNSTRYNGITASLY